MHAECLNNLIENVGANGAEQACSVVRECSTQSNSCGVDVGPSSLNLFLERITGMPLLPESGTGLLQSGHREMLSTEAL